MRKRCMSNNDNKNKAIQYWHEVPHHYSLLITHYSLKRAHYLSIVTFVFTDFVIAVKSL